MKVALSTGGGDAPGLNSVIRAATLSAVRRGWEVVGIRDGFDGLRYPEHYSNGGGIVALTRDTVRGIAHLGGTVLGSTNRGDPTAFPVQQLDGSWTTVDRTDELISQFRAAGVDALITIGGDGSLTIGRKLCDAGMRVIGVPKTIDNDLDATDATFGFDTAVEVATESIGRVFTTATSHSRIFVVEVMGRYAGWIALNSGLASGAHAILIPEIPFDLRNVAAMIARREARGARFAISVVAEGAKPIGGGISVLGRAIDQAERLGGIGVLVAEELERLTGKEARTVVLGHLLRGGTPTALDRLIGLRFGTAAIRGIEAGYNGVMVALRPTMIDFVPLSAAVSKLRTVPPDCDTILSGRDLGVSFGDEG
ncbi:MAG: ATP-dependent phosphofructokinase / diphosphate-dependent phosphofructokinase [Acidimicrobiaceae bacterium]|nr:ATP-dependent phosphofructokinase / diphosphate-dependent phosphofructokinase [Acidimicrobiaceae bacterium]